MSPQCIAVIERENNRRFIDIDREILSGQAEVLVIRYEGRITVSHIVLSAKAALKCAVLYSFFASEHALVPALFFRILRKPVVITTGGYDTADDREHGYGLVATHRGWLVKLLVFLATELLPFSERAERELAAISPAAMGKAEVVPLCIETAPWADPGVERIASQVVTCASVDSVSWSRKGIDRFVAVARANPELTFVLAGSISSEAGTLLEAHGIPKNLCVTGPLSQAELVRVFWSSQVYSQFSWHEGFGLAMAEAMSCGCTPVITAAGALPEVAGEWAFQTNDPSSDSHTLQKALSANIDREAMAKDIGTRFSFEARQMALTNAVFGHDFQP